MIVFFDGVCNLCNQSVQFIIKRDHKNIFQFASLQSGYAKQKLAGKIDVEKLESIVLLIDNQVYTKSTAALKIAKSLSGLWPIFYLLIVIPKPIRDWLYSLVAKNRYSIFGKRDSCMIPEPAYKQKFLDNNF